MGEAYRIEWSGFPTKKKQLWFAKVDGSWFKTYSAAQSIKGRVGETNPEFANIMDKLEKDTSYHPWGPEYVEGSKESIHIVLTKY